MMKSTNILLIVNNSWGEVDWILPVMEVLKSCRDVKIWVYFSSMQILKDVKEYEDLYSRLTKISVDIYTPWNIKRKLGFKRQFAELIKINRSHKLGYYRFIRKIGSIVRGRFHAMFNSSELLRLKVPESIDYLFHDYSGVDFSSYYREFNSAQVVVFPHGTFLFNLLNSAFQQQIKRSLSYNKIKNDAFLLLGSPINIPYFRELTGLKNIVAVGYPKFESSWINSFPIDDKKSKPTLLYLLIPKRKVSGEGIFAKYIESVIEIARRNNMRLLIKKHPRQGESEIEEILENYPNEDIEIARNSVLHTALLSDITICFPTSACMDAIAAGIPVIEYFDYTGQHWSTLVEMDGEITSVYRMNDMVLASDDLDELRESVEKIIKDAEFRDRLVKKQRQVWEHLQYNSGQVIETIVKVLNLSHV